MYGYKLVINVLCKSAIDLNLILEYMAGIDPKWWISMPIYLFSLFSKAKLAQFLHK